MQPRSGAPNSFLTARLPELLLTAAPFHASLSHKRVPGRRQHAHCSFAPSTTSSRRYRTSPLAPFNMGMVSLVSGPVHRLEHPVAAMYFLTIPSAIPCD